MIELASFSEFNETHQSFLDQLMESVGIVSTRSPRRCAPRACSKQSQLLTQELQARQTELTTKQEELHATNEELQEKAQLLENEKKQVEAKNLEIDMARRAVEEKAEQLALTSKYKSEFLANMSHELRTPLNSLLILSKLLADNPQGNLNEKQTEFARTIHSAGSDLLSLINDILDLSKIESGTVSIDLGDMPMSGLKQHMERTFRQLAADKGLDFDVRVRRQAAGRQSAPTRSGCSRSSSTSCPTPSSSPRRAASRWRSAAPTAAGAPTIRCCATSTGRSRSRSATPASAFRRDKQRLIFEAFQQADGTTSRKYGGTGLGLSISREIARLLGGELQVKSKPGEGVDLHPVRSVGSGRGRRPGSHRGDPARRRAKRRQPAAGRDRDHRRPRQSRQRSPFVLIVEDDVDVRLDPARLGARGRAQGRGLDRRRRARSALARKLQPDAITLDLGLDDINGFVLLDLLQHDAATKRNPGPRDLRRRGGCRRHWRWAPATSPRSRPTMRRCPSCSSRSATQAKDGKRRRRSKAGDDAASDAAQPARAGREPRC